MFSASSSAARLCGREKKSAANGIGRRKRLPHHSKQWTCKGGAGGFACVGLGMVMAAGLHAKDCSVNVYAHIGDAPRDALTDQIHVYRALANALLAHVMAHEVTHVLEKSRRHSKEGVMKAHWSTEDYRRMEYSPLPFAPEDVELIREGLARRMSQGVGE